MPTALFTREALFAIHFEGLTSLRSFNYNHILLQTILYFQNNEKIFSIEDLGLSEAVIAELKDKGICKLEITVRVAQAGTACSDPDSLCHTSPYKGSELASFILDKELLNAVGNACRWCTTPRDVNDRVLSLLRQSRIWNQRIFLSKPFLASLIPLLTNFPQKPNINQIYMAVYRCRVMKT